MHEIEKLKHRQVNLIRDISFTTPIKYVIDKLNEVIDVVNEITNKINRLVSAYLEDGE